MKVGIYDIPNELILRYCKILNLLENKYSSELEWARSDVHNQIFDYVKCYRSLCRREDREFNTALNRIVVELCYAETDI